MVECPLAKMALNLQLHRFAVPIEASELYVVIRILLAICSPCLPIILETGGKVA